jgi:hypothetical protein
MGMTMRDISKKKNLGTSWVNGYNLTHFQEKAGAVLTHGESTVISGDPLKLRPEHSDNCKL